MPNRTEPIPASTGLVLAGLAPRDSLAGIVAEMDGAWAVFTHQGLEALVWRLSGERLTMAEVGSMNLDILALMAVTDFLPVKLAAAVAPAELRQRLSAVSLDDALKAAAKVRGHAQMDIICCVSDAAEAAQTPPKGGDYLRQLHARKSKQPDASEMENLHKLLAENALATTSWQTDPKRGLVMAVCVPLSDVQDFTALVARICLEAPVQGYAIKLAGPFAPLSFTPSLEHLAASAADITESREK